MTRETVDTGVTDDELDEHRRNVRTPARHDPVIGRTWHDARREGDRR